MITHEQYVEYKRLVDEYEQAEYEENQREADAMLSDDEDYGDDDDFDEYDSRHGCTCGAWTYGAKGFIHMADCCCGAE